MSVGTSMLVPIATTALLVVVLNALGLFMGLGIVLLVARSVVLLALGGLLWICGEQEGATQPGARLLTRPW